MTYPLALCAAAVLVAFATTPARAQAPAAAPAAASPSTFTLTAVKFPDTTAVPNEVLQNAVAPFIGKPMGQAELDALTNALRREYEARGLGLVGIGLPSQDLANGVLLVAISEPRIARLIVENPEKPPIADTRTRAVLERNGVVAGQPLNLHHFDRAMYTLNDWPGVKAKATLTPTGDENSYSVDVKTESARAWEASVDADNHGTDISGRARVGGMVRWNNPLGIGDNLDLRLVASQGSGNLVGRLGYEAPLGPTPWRAGVGYSRVNYELGGGFEGATGTADVVDTSLSYPWIRSRDLNVIGRATAEYKRLYDEFIGDNSTKNISAVTLQASFESRDGWGGGGYNGGFAGVMFGHLRSTATNALSIDSTAVGQFTKVTGQATRLQSLTQRFSLFVGLAGQWASQNLDNAEKMTLGGPRGVRSYPAAEAPSDLGAILNTEVRYWVNPQWSTFLFYDVGHGRARKDAGDSLDDNQRTLHGTGLGVQYTNPELFTLKATLGVRGKSEPVLSDTDNTGRSLFLVQVQHSF